MAERTKIEWATHTWNPWIGCTKVHAGCTHCYAEAMAGRLGVTWGPQGTRRRTAHSTWMQVERWDTAAIAHGERRRVFSSLCDWFEEWTGPVATSEWSEAWWYNGSMVDPPTSGVSQQIGYRPLMMADVRSDAFAVVDRCPNLDFLIATKRPWNVRRMWPYLDGDTTGRVREWMAEGESQDVHTLFRRNVWLIYSAADQATLESGLPHLLACRDLVPVLGLSLEPLIGPVDIRGVLGLNDDGTPDHKLGVKLVDWVIVGGESGPNARPCEIEWIESIVNQCRAAGVPCWVKQDCGPKPGMQGRIPNDLWAVKEFPTSDAGEGAGC